jgi:catechol 2,3-dioxygenase-like lactoylglutathione lyase family enzyme
MKEDAMQTATEAREAQAAAMRVDGTDHINIVIRDVDTSVAFYSDVLGLEPVALDEYRAGTRGIFSFRVTDSFVIHVRPDPTAPRPVTRDREYDHLCLTVTGVTPEELLAYLAEHGIASEGGIVTRWGARGDGAAIYVTDPDGYRVELKVYSA